MEGEGPGLAVTPRPWQPHTLSSAEQCGGTTHLGRTFGEHEVEGASKPDFLKAAG
jgi:hypothetical protein